MSASTWCILSATSGSDSSGRLTAALFGLIGVLIGWGLKVSSDAVVARRSRQRDAAESMNDALTEIWLMLRAEGSTRPERLSAARTEFRKAWWRYAPRLTDTELKERVRSAGQMLWLAEDLVDHRRDLDFAIDRAIRNAQVSLSAFVDGRKFPERCFPSPDEARDLIWEERSGAATRLREWLDAHPHPRPASGPWTPQDPPDWSRIRSS